MKKIYTLIFIMALSMMLYGCGSTELQGSVPPELVGEWHCQDMASDGVTETGFYALRVEEDGSFSLYDQAAGNPGISGKMAGEEGQVQVVCGDEDFDPPYCWKMKKKDTLTYDKPNDYQIRLGYEDIWLTFSDENTDNMQSFELYDRDEHHQWNIYEEGDAGLLIDIYDMDNGDDGSISGFTVAGAVPGEKDFTLKYESADGAKYEVTYKLSVHEDLSITLVDKEGDLDQEVEY